MSNSSQNHNASPSVRRRKAIQVAASLAAAGAAGSMAAAQNGSSSRNRQGTVNAAASSLGSRIRGFQHFGVTVQNMSRAFEFYTEVLGGTEVMRDGDFHGEPIQNTHEEIAAKQQHINPRTIGVPDLRHGAQRLDVRFVQFDNLVVELLQYRDQNQPAGGGSSFAPPHERTGPAFSGSTHICFYIKDDTDFDQFIRDLETEAARRGMTNVKANRTRPASSEAERVAAPLDANTNKIKQGPSNGWSQIYCKGPEGEQLEFVQVLGPLKQTFDGSIEKRQRILKSRA